MEMTHFVGLDVSVKETAVCVVDSTGKVVCEQKVPTEPDDIIILLTSIGKDYSRVGIEAGPLSQWLVNELTAYVDGTVLARTSLGPRWLRWPDWPGTTAPGFDLLVHGHCPAQFLGPAERRFSVL
jgi:hypothetical protein